jgi:hypothetical protein
MCTNAQKRGKMVIATRSSKRGASSKRKEEKKQQTEVSKTTVACLVEAKQPEGSLPAGTETSFDFTKSRERGMEAFAYLSIGPKLLHMGSANLPRGVGSPDF